MNGPLAGKRLLVAEEDSVLSGVLAGAVGGLGGTAVRCASGRAALAALEGATPFDGAVVDLPLPDLPGAELLSALRRSGVPAVALSLTHRGAQAADEALRAGAADYFEKPFPILTLLSRLARLMGTGLTEPPVAGDEVTGAALLPPPLDPSGHPVDDAPFLDLAGEEALGEPPGPLPHLEPPRPDGQPGRGRGEAAPTEGDLGEVTVPRLLVALHLAQFTGTLTLRRGPAAKLVVLERGAPVYAASNLTGERLAALCLRRGLVDPAGLAALRREAPSEPTAALLRRARILGEARLHELTCEQVRAIAWSTFEWREGRYALALGRPPPGLRILRLSTADLLLEGLVRVSTPARLAAELPLGLRLAPTTAPAFELYALGLRQAEAHLLSLCDGTRSVDDLVAQARLPEREAMAFLQACRVLQVLDVAERVLARAGRAGSM